MNDPFDPNLYDAEIKKHEQESPKKERDLSTLEEFEVTDGKDRSDEIQKLKDLEEILGIRDVNPYGTHNREIFEEKVNDMSMTEMQSLAMKIGFPPTRDRLSLRKGLIRSFDTFLKTHSAGAVHQPQPVFDENSPNYAEAKKLFSL